jgi:hypothetical protein
MALPLFVVRMIAKGTRENARGSTRIDANGTNVVHATLLCWPVSLEGELRVRKAK